MAQMNINLNMFFSVHPNKVSPTASNLQDSLSRVPQSGSAEQNLRIKRPRILDLEQFLPFHNKS